jgi:hypothetical protein
MIVGYKMNSDRMGYITWNQWLNFMKPLLMYATQLYLVSDTYLFDLL